MLTHGSLFSGIGGFDLAAEWAGWTNIFHCEWNDFGKRVLNYYWPNATSYDDITKTDFTIHRGAIDVLTGGFPCQPYSQAGKRLGKEDERHLWPEMLRAIREIQPRWVVGENVRGIITWNAGLVFDEVQADMEAAGYEVLPFLLPAAGVNAPHERYRIWFVANATSDRRIGAGQGIEIEEGLQPRPEQSGQLAGRFEGLRNNGDVANIKCSGLQRRWNGRNGLCKETPKRQAEIFCNIDAADATNIRQSGKKYRKEKPRRITETSLSNDWSDFPTQSPVCGRNDGISTELVRQRIRTDSMGLLSEKEIDQIISKAITKHREESIKAYGNAIVAPLFFQICKAINEYEQLTA